MRKRDSIIPGADFTSGFKIIVVCFRRGDKTWPGNRGCKGKK